MGAFAASRANSLVDSALMASAQVGLAIPNFWFGILMVLLFSITLGWFPAGGFPGWETGFFNGLQALFLRPSPWPCHKVLCLRGLLEQPCSKRSARISCARPAPRA